MSRHEKGSRKAAGSDPQTSRNAGESWELPSRRAFLGGAGALTAALAFPEGLNPPVSAMPLLEAPGTPPSVGAQRREMAFNVRHQAALAERNRPVLEHPINGDEDLYPDKLASFSKGLPHNALGIVDPDAYRALLRAVGSGRFEDFEAVPLGGTAKLSNPMAGFVFSLQGPDPWALGVARPPTFASAEMAAEMAELYWMALLRDVPLSDYPTDPRIAAAAEDLSKFPDLKAPKDPQTGRITAATLFRSGYPGALDGPMVSQFLLLNCELDGVSIAQRIQTPLPVIDGDGIEFLTGYDEWLAVQRGFPAGTTPGRMRPDPTPRYVRNARDLGQCADASALVSTYLKAALLLFSLGGPAIDERNPYKASRIQGGFAAYGLGSLLCLLGHVAGSSAHVGYHKWNVHRLLRPEAFAARVHHQVTGAASYPVHQSLLTSPVLEKVFRQNAMVNQRRAIGDGKGTYLLPVMFGVGCPRHPSYPAGHATAAGVGVTLLKAWFKEDFVLPETMTVKPNRDGTALEPYRPGVDGPPLTIGGELNKLAANITLGRNLSGIHYRFDGIEGNRLGEELTLRLLAETRATYPEHAGGFAVTRFDGSKVTI